MARPKSVFVEDLSIRAQADLDSPEHKKVALKLQAIIAAVKYPVGMVAEIFGVSAETIWRWATSYRKCGVDGLYPKPRRPKPSKLSPAQKAETLAWLDTGKTAGGENTHWTLERLRQAILEAFGVTLGINTIWVWLRKENLKLKVPRPQHYKADNQAQEAFKKTSGIGAR
jgi:transposase